MHMCHGKHAWKACIAHGSVVCAQLARCLCLWHIWVCAVIRPPLITCTCGVGVGSAFFVAPLGAKLAHALPERTLKRCFAVGLVVVGVMLVREAWLASAAS